MTVNTIQDASSIKENPSQDSFADDDFKLLSTDQKIIEATNRLKKDLQERIKRGSEKSKKSTKKEQELTKLSVEAKQNAGNTLVLQGASDVTKMLQDKGALHSVRGLFVSDNSISARRAFDSSALGLTFQAASTVATAYANKAKSTHEATDAKLQMESGQEKDRIASKRETKNELQNPINDANTTQNELMNKVSGDSRTINGL
jgi:hypothetical protein